MNSIKKPDADEKSGTFPSDNVVIPVEAEWMFSMFIQRLKGVCVFSENE